MKYGMRGLGLTELMIALVLSIIILNGTIHLYLGIKQQLKSQQALSRLQQTIRVTSLMLGKFIRSDGSLGCLNLRYLPESIQLRFNKKAKMKSKHKHVLWVRRMHPIFNIKNKIEPGDQEIWVQGKLKVKKNHWMVLSDCAGAELLEVLSDAKYSKKKGTLIKFKAAIQNYYNLGSYIGPFESQLIYIDNKKLYLHRLNYKPVQLVEGVSDFQIQSMIKASQEIGFSIKITAQDIEIPILKKTWTEEICFR